MVPIDFGSFEISYFLIHFPFRHSIFFFVIRPRTLYPSINCTNRLRVVQNFILFDSFSFSTLHFVFRYSTSDTISKYKWYQSTSGLSKFHIFLFIFLFDIPFCFSLFDLGSYISLFRVRYKETWMLL